MSNTLISDAKIRQVIEDTCRANKCTKLAEKITASWSNHLISKTGQFSLRDDSIQLSTQVLGRLDAKRQAEAVSRETCALICWHVYKNTAHEQQWRVCMEKAGYPDAKYKQKLPLKGLKRQAYKPHERFLFSCGCPRKPYRLNAIVGKHIALDGQDYECSDCGKSIVVVKIAYRLHRNDTTPA